MKGPWDLHNIVSSQEHNRSFQLLIEGYEFIPKRVIVTLANGTSKGLKTTRDLREFYLGQDMLDTAMMAAYYANISFFSVLVQRKGKEIQIVHVKENKEKKIPYDFDKFHRETSLIGADIEVMATRRDGSFISFPLDRRYDRKIGADRALIRKGTSFYQPIIELRSDPKGSGKELYEEFSLLKKELQSRAEKKDLLIISDENPTGRFFLGGHFHISNAFPTYRKVSLLDSLLTLPIASISKSKKCDRRSNYGKLGAVRLNRFNGFEYRSLPSWYKYIEEGEPFFTWVETVLFNEGMPKITLSERAIFAYYKGDHDILRDEVSKIHSYASKFLTKEEKGHLEKWKKWLEKNVEID